MNEVKKITQSKGKILMMEPHQSAPFIVQVHGSRTLGSATTDQTISSESRLPDEVTSEMRSHH